MRNTPAHSTTGLKRRETAPCRGQRVVSVHEAWLNARLRFSILGAAQRVTPGTYLMRPFQSGQFFPVAGNEFSEANQLLSKELQTFVASLLHSQTVHPKNDRFGPFEKV